MHSQFSRIVTALHSVWLLKVHYVILGETFETLIEV